MKYAAVIVGIAFVLVANLPGEHVPGIDMGAEYDQLATLQGRSNDQRGQLLEEWLRAAGMDVEFQPIADHIAGETRERVGNLVVTIGEGQSDILLAAHFDAAHSGGRISGGIVDNGAATLVLSRLARYLSRQSLRHRIRVVFFDVEEVDQAGSRTYVELFGDRTAAMLNLDVIGLGETAIYGPTGNPNNVILAETMQRACATGNHSCMNFARVPTSDDVTFSQAGVPVLSIGMFPRVDAHQFWLALNGGDGSGLGRHAVPRTLRIVNSMDDTADEVAPEAMETAFCVLRDLVLLLDTTLS